MEQLNYAIRKEQTVIGSACAERQGRLRQSRTASCAFMRTTEKTA